MAGWAVQMSSATELIFPVPSANIWLSTHVWALEPWPIFPSFVSPVAPAQLLSPSLVTFEKGEVPSDLFVTITTFHPELSSEAKAGAFLPLLLSPPPLPQNPVHALACVCWPQSAPKLTGWVWIHLQGDGRKQFSSSCGINCLVFLGLQRPVMRGWPSRQSLLSRPAL